MRGKAVNGYVTFLHVGITPAYAGKSRRSQEIFQRREDHPRLCGEKSYETSRFLRQIGSPPPMRGKDFFVVQPCTANGITPAYAGKSEDSIVVSNDGWDHPRLCGEKARHNRGTDFVPGSPPPMRGKVTS